MWKTFLGVFMLSLACGAYGVSVHFQDCGPIGSYMVEEVFLNVPCKVQPCWFPLKKQTNMTVSFKSSNTIALDIKPEVHFMVANTREWIDITTLACPKNVCPIRAQEKKSYSIIVKPNLHADPIRVEVYWELFNQKHEKLFCIFFPAIIYDPQTHRPNTRSKILGNPVLDKLFQSPLEQKENRLTNFS